MQTRKDINIFQRRQFAGNFGDRSIAESLALRQEAKGKAATTRTREAKLNIYK